MAFQGFQKVQCLLQFSLTKKTDRLIHQGLSPAFKGLAMNVKVAMARSDQLLLQHESCDGVALLPELFGVLLTTEGLFFRCPIPQGSHSVVFINGLPTLQEQTAGEVSHQPWPGIELVLPLEPAGEQGEDCLRLRWSIDQEAQLQLEINDLRSGRTWSQPTLGAVR